MFSSMNNWSQSSLIVPLASLTYTGNFLSVVPTSQSKIFWIIDTSASDQMTNAHHLFISYSLYSGNPKVRVVDGSLSTVI